jgi:hypothetical protein
MKIAGMNSIYCILFLLYDLIPLTWMTTLDCTDHTAVMCVEMYRKLLLIESHHNMRASQAADLWGF